jgi:hypothetical protein
MKVDAEAEIGKKTGIGAGIRIGKRKLRAGAEVTVK